MEALKKNQDASQEKLIKGGFSITEYHTADLPLDCLTRQFLDKLYVWFRTVNKLNNNVVQLADRIEQRARLAAA